MAFMKSLGRYKAVLEDLHVNLQAMVRVSFKRNSDYFKSTLEKIINRLLFDAEEEDNYDSDGMYSSSNLNSLFNMDASRYQLLDRVKRDIAELADYQDNDQSCVSFKSFMNLLETNDLFSSVRVDENSYARSNMAA